MTILLLEDDFELGRLIETELKGRNYDVDWCQTLSDAQKALAEKSYPLSIVDLNLPDGHGFDLLSSKKSEAYIIMSALSDPENRLKGVELGAVDFIPKPFLMQELFLKIERTLGSIGAKSPKWTIGDVSLDLGARQIQNGETTHLLNKRDFRLLDVLTSHAPEVVSRDKIIDHVYGENNNPSHRTIDNAVVGLRQMLSDTDHAWIRSVRGEGYQWVAKGESE